MVCSFRRVPYGLPFLKPIGQIMGKGKFLTVWRGFPFFVYCLVGFILFLRIFRYVLLARFFVFLICAAIHIGAKVHSRTPKKCYKGLYQWFSFSLGKNIRWLGYPFLIYNKSTPLLGNFQPYFLCSLVV